MSGRVMSATLKAAEAEAAGDTVRWAGDNEVLLDLDTPVDVEFYEKMLKSAKGNLTLTEVERWTSKSGVGTHVVLRTEQALTVLDRLLLQAVLGSDRLREFLAYCCYREGEKDVSILIKPKVVG